MYTWFVCPLLKVEPKPDVCVFMLLKAFPGVDVVTFDANNGVDVDPNGLFCVLNIFDEVEGLKAKVLVVVTAVPNPVTDFEKSPELFDVPKFVGKLPKP